MSRPRAYSPVVRLAIINAVKAGGESTADIAERFGVPIRTLRWWLYEERISVRQRARDAAYTSDAKAAYAHLAAEQPDQRPTNPFPIIRRDQRKATCYGSMDARTPIRSFGMSCAELIIWLAITAILCILVFPMVAEHYQW